MEVITTLSVLAGVMILVKWWILTGHVAKIKNELARQKQEADYLTQAEIAFLQSDREKAIDLVNIGIAAEMVAANREFEAPKKKEAIYHKYRAAAEKLDMPLKTLDFYLDENSYLGENSGARGIRLV